MKNVLIVSIFSLLLIGYCFYIANKINIPQPNYVSPQVEVIKQVPVVQPSCVYYSFRYGAICRDGWRSSATGSGACSHHGGVYQWLYSSYCR